jgi:hypothetical protein
MSKIFLDIRRPIVEPLPRVPLAKGGRMIDRVLCLNLVSYDPWNRIYNEVQRETLGFRPTRRGRWFLH